MQSKEGKSGSPHTHLFLSRTYGMRHSIEKIKRKLVCLLAVVFTVHHLSGYGFAEEAVSAETEAAQNREGQTVVIPESDHIYVNGSSRKFTAEGEISALLRLTVESPGVVHILSSGVNITLVLYDEATDEICGFYASEDGLLDVPFDAAAGTYLLGFSGWGEAEVLAADEENTARIYEEEEAKARENRKSEDDMTEDSEKEDTEETPDDSSEDETADDAPVDPAIPVVNAAKIMTTGNITKKLMKIKFPTSSAVTNYLIQYRMAGKKAWKSGWSAGTNTYVIQGLKKSSLCEFRIAGYEKQADGTWVRGKWSKISYRYMSAVPLKTAKAGQKCITATWKKDKKASGYQIQISLKKSMKGAKTITVMGKSKTKYKIKGLKSGKKYYVKVRPIKKKSGKKYLGVLTKSKAARVK